MTGAGSTPVTELFLDSGNEDDLTDRSPTSTCS
jgi:hypothetical protein